MSFQAFLYAAFSALARGVQRLPRPRALHLAAAFAGAVYALYRLTPYRGFIRGNLKQAYGGALSDVGADAIAKGHLVRLAQAIVEVMRFPALEADGLDTLVGFTGWEHLEAAREAGKGVILVTAHFGNWELLGAALARRGVPLHVLVQPPSQAAFDRLFNEFRAGVGVSSWPNRGPASLRPVLRALARNEALGLLADQHGEAQEAVVEFFGRPVSAPTGAFFFSRRTGAPVLPVFVVRQPDSTHRVVIDPALPAGLDDQALAQRLYSRFEGMIRDYPDHWLWVHDRFAREGELRRGEAHLEPVG